MLETTIEKETSSNEESSSKSGVSSKNNDIKVMNSNKGFKGKENDKNINFTSQTCATQKHSEKHIWSLGIY